MIQVNRIYLIFNRLVTKKFLVDTSDEAYKKQDTFHPLLFPLHERQRHTRIQLPAQAQRQCKRRMGEGQKGMKLIL